MKKFIGLLFISALMFQLFAAPAAAPSVSANKYMQLLTSQTTAWDTISGVDSSVFATKILIPTGHSVILNRAAISGTGSDSVIVTVVVDAYDINNVFLYRTVVDTFTAAAGEQVDVPIFDTIFGDKFTIKLVSLTGTGGQLILNSMRLYSRKLYDGTKQYVGN